MGLDDLGTKKPGGGRGLGGVLSVSIVTGLQMVADFIVIMAAAMLCWRVATDTADAVSFERYVCVAVIAAGICVSALWCGQLYDFEAISRPWAHTRGFLAALAIAFLVLLFLAFSLGHVDVAYSRVWVYLFLVVSTGLLLIERHLAARLIFLLADHGHVARNIVIVGGQEQGLHLITLLRRTAFPWVHMVGFFDDRLQRVPSSVDSYPVLGDVRDLVIYSRTHRIDDIFVAMPWVAEDRLRQLFESLQVIPANVHMSPEMLSSRLIQTQFVPYFGMTALRVARKPVDGWNHVLKSVEDRLIASVGLLFLLPLFLLIALAVRLDTPGPVLFRQKRFGFNNKLIEVYKFRSLHHEQRDAGAAQQVSKGDVRVTRVGRFLRQFSLDELPQLFNVLKGDMSIVGPRPHAVQTKAAGRLFEDVVKEYALRHKIKPGITGWAQVSGWRGETDTEDKLINRVKFDLYYIENWSIIFDFKIILMTAYVFLFSRSY